VVETNLHTCLRPIVQGQGMDTGKAARAADSKSNGLRRPWLKQEEGVKSWNDWCPQIIDTLLVYCTRHGPCSQVQRMALIGGGAHGWPVKDGSACALLALRPVREF
jgi:hypothetical protein